MNKTVLGTPVIKGRTQTRDEHVPDPQVAKELGITLMSLWRTPKTGIWTSRHPSRSARETFAVAVCSKNSRSECCTTHSRDVPKGRRLKMKNQISDGVSPISKPAESSAEPRNYTDGQRVRALARDLGSIPECVGYCPHLGPSMSIRDSKMRESAFHAGMVAVFNTDTHVSAHDVCL